MLVSGQGVDRQVWIIGILLLLTIAYYRLLARPLFQGEHAKSRLLQRVWSMTIMVWLGTQLRRVRDQIVPCIKDFYDKGTLCRDTIKVIVNFLQIVGSFARHAHERMRTRTRAHAHAHARMHARTHSHSNACTHARSLARSQD